MDGSQPSAEKHKNKRLLQFYKNRDLNFRIITQYIINPEKRYMK